MSEASPPAGPSPAAPQAATDAASTSGAAAEPQEAQRLHLSAARLAPLLYADLRRLAHRVRWGSGASDTLQTTALVHESFLKLQASPQWQDRQHFLCAAALAMRQVVVDDLRRRHTARRGGGAADVPLDSLPETAAAQATTHADDAADERILAIDQAMQRLAALNPRLARTVECRFFAGYSEAETAQALGVSVATVQRDWVKARAWLHRALSPADGA